MKGMLWLALALVLTGCASAPSRLPPVTSGAQTSAPVATPAASMPPATAEPAQTAPAPAPVTADALRPLTPTPLLGGHAYSGRISITIQSGPMQHMTAEFELQGDARNGELKLYGPFGGLFAVLQWAPDRAVLIEGERRRSVRSIDWLIERVTGAPLPVALIFDWLAGRQVRNDDWSVAPRDNLQAPLRATRLQPLPRIELVVALKRPGAP